MYNRTSLSVGDASDSEPDSWDDFSVAESEKEHAGDGQSYEKLTSPKRGLQSPMSAGSSRSKLTAQKSQQSMRYDAEADLRSEPSSPGRMLPAMPRSKKQPDVDGKAVAASTPVAAARTTQQIPEPVGHVAHKANGRRNSHDPETINNTSEYRPSFHDRRPSTQSKAASLANRSLTTEPAVHLQRYDQPSVRNGAHHFNETGDAPHGFEEQAGGPRRQSSKKATTPAPGKGYKPGYASTSSIEVSSKIMDDEDFQTSRHHSSPPIGGKRRRGSYRDTLSAQHDDSEDEDHHNRSSQLGNAADGTEEQGLLPIKPGDRSVAWGHQQRRPPSQQKNQRVFQGDLPEGRKDSRLSHMSDQASDPAQQGKLVDYHEDYYSSTQFIYHSVSDGQHAPASPIPEPYMLGIAQKSENIFNRVWGELFATLSIPLLFITTFVAHLSQFTLSRFIKRPLMLIQVFSDHLFKPLLTVLHNSIIQPVLVLLANIVSNVTLVVLPVMDLVSHVTRLVSDVLKSFRLIEYHQHHGQDQQQQQQHHPSRHRTRHTSRRTDLVQSV